MTTTAEAPFDTRRAVDLFVWWVEQVPAECGIGLDELEPLIAKVAGHPVDSGDVEDLRCALALPRTTDTETDVRRSRIEEVVERLADTTPCDDCGRPVVENPLPDCPHGDWCSAECLTAFHGSYYCPAVGL